jgi:ABC-2 type transport system ATP-binding protein
MLRVVNLKKSYGKLEVLNGISFEIKKGTVYGFLGQNGAGKSTTMNILTGLIEYNGGDIFIDGKDFKSHKFELIKKIGYLTENPVFYNYMNAYEYLSFLGEVSGYKHDKIKNRIDELLELVKLKDAAKRKVGGYSRGMKQRLGVAIAMFNHPEILFLDEPTSALDPGGRMEMLDLIEGLKEQNITVFLSSHILNDVERVCDEVSILHEGKIILSDKLEELKNKYIQPIYDIEFNKKCSSIRDALTRLDWVQNVQMEGSKKLSVFVKDINIANSRLLKELPIEDNHIISFQLRKNNLEDIFMRMVNSNGNV